MYDGNVTFCLREPTCLKNGGEQQQTQTDAHLVFRSWSLIFFSISASVRVSSRGHHWSASPVFLMAISTVGRGFSLQHTKHRQAPLVRLSDILRPGKQTADPSGQICPTSGRGQIADTSPWQLTKTPVSTLKQLSEQFPQPFHANL